MFSTNGLVVVPCAEGHSHTAQLLAEPFHCFAGRMLLTVCIRAGKGIAEKALRMARTRPAAFLQVAGRDHNRHREP